MQIVQFGERYERFCLCLKLRFKAGVPKARYDSGCEAGKAHSAALVRK